MFKVYFFLLALLLAYTSAKATPEDRDKQILLSADLIDINQTTHRGTYKGHVNFDQGSSHLRASYALTQGDMQNKLLHAKALGDKHTQAHFWTKPAQDKPMINAYANSIYYYPARHLITLAGLASITQEQNSISAPIINIDTQTKHISSSGSGKIAATIVIYPGKEHE